MPPAAERNPYADLHGPAARRLLTGFVSLEPAHTDPSLNSFFGIHNGLAMGSVDLCGSDEQRARWLPAMARMEKIGAKERARFGRPIAGFQLVQDLLVRMLGNLTASLGIAVRLAQLQDAGEARDEVGRAITGHSAFVR